MSVTWFENPEGLPYVRAMSRMRDRFPMWGFSWREVGRNSTHAFIVLDHDGPHRLACGLPTEAVDPLTVGDEGRGRRTSRCLDTAFPEVPARVRARRKAFLRSRPTLARSVERHRASVGLVACCW